MLDATDLTRCVSSGVHAFFVGEYGEQAAIAGIELQVILIRLAKVRLLEDERHAQRTLPEIHGALLRRSDDGDVMNALYL